jgi:NAD(P)-dependent dehydrogenase (short-subunit alcohol dehydrogenase family)
MLRKIKNKLLKELFTGDVIIEACDDLEGFSVIITGASRGIGKATAEVLYKKGAKVVLVSRDLNDLRKTFKDFNDEKTLLLEGDVTREDDAKRIIKEAINKFGRIDVLINNAGIFMQKPIDETSLEEYEALMGTNVKGAFLMLKAVVPEMKKKKEGLIINIGSKISHNTNVLPNRVLYATSKYAIEGMSYALNKELRVFGIRVTCLMPGTVNTYLSFRSGQFLSPYCVGEVIATIIRSGDIDFENFVIKSTRQNI